MDDLTMKDWCHIIFCRYIIGAVLLCKLCIPHSWHHQSRHQVTKSVIFFKNCYISFNISVRASIQSLKCRIYAWLSRRHIQLPMSLSAKSFSWPQNGGHFEKIEHTASISPQPWNDHLKLSQIIFMVMIDYVTGWSIYSCLGEVGKM